MEEVGRAQAPPLTVAHEPGRVAAQAQEFGSVVETHQELHAVCEGDEREEAQHGGRPGGIHGARLGFARIHAVEVSAAGRARGDDAAHEIAETGKRLGIDEAWRGIREQAAGGAHDEHALRAVGILLERRDVFEAHLALWEGDVRSGDNDRRRAPRLCDPAPEHDHERCTEHGTYRHRDGQRRKVPEHAAQPHPEEGSQKAKRHAEAPAHQWGRRAERVGRDAFGLGGFSHQESISVVAARGASSIQAGGRC